MTDRHLIAVARQGLSDDPAQPSLPLDEHDIDHLLPKAVEHRLVGALAAAVRDGTVELTPAAFERVADQHEAWSRQVLRVERLLLDAAAALRRHAIQYRLLKGASLARTVYADPSERLYVDVDLIVPGDRLAEAADVIATATGGTRTLPELRPGHDEEFGKEVTIRVGESEIDLHRTFVTGPIGLTIPLDELFADGGALHLAGQEIDVLAPMHQFVHVCINAAVGDRPTRLQSLRDVATVARAIDPDPGEVEAIARRWRCLAAVRHAIVETHEVLALPPVPLSEWAHAVQQTRTDRLVLRSYLAPARSYTRPLASLVVIRGVRPRLRYLGALVWPARDYLAARNWSRAGHARRAIGRLTRVRR